MSMFYYIVLMVFGITILFTLLGVYYLVNEEGGEKQQSEKTVREISDGRGMILFIVGICMTMLFTALAILGVS